MTVISNGLSPAATNGNSINSNARLLQEAPDDYGLLLSLDSEGTCHLTFVEDANYADLHPNIYAPAALRDARKLGGGGSGVTVFQGELPDDLGGSVVMKHGSNKDTAELFALATIAKQLNKRGEQCCHEIVADMQWRIPEFRAMYASPWHFCERHREMWSKLRRVLYKFRSVDSEGSFESYLKNTKFSGTKRHGRVICLYRNNGSDGKETDNDEKKEIDNDDNMVCIDCKSIEITLDASFSIVLDKQGKPSLQYGEVGDGYAVLKPLVDQLMALQKQNFWKFTLAQKTIGGPSPRTPSSLLAAGLLHGDLLQNLIDEFVAVIRNLQSLTLPEERPAVKQIQEELAQIEANPILTCKVVSPLANAFVGSAIRKNFTPEKGRFSRLRDMGKEFRAGKFSLQPEEEVPAHFLGILLQRGAQMNQVYADSPGDNTALDGSFYFSWRDLLRQATSLKSRAAVDRIWNCGLADAGLHNLFLSDGKLWLFDLGEPSLQSLPGFLTKFLFSFFHTLGMEEDHKGSWVNRFIHKGDLLELTPETKELLPQAYEAFEITLDQLVDGVFEGEEAVRPLLIRYMTLQFLSDASFCLEKWRIKGGGQKKLSNNHQQHNEKWLWRSLWDMYAAFDINTKKWTKE